MRAASSWGLPSQRKGILARHRDAALTGHPASYAPKIEKLVRQHRGAKRAVIAGPAHVALMLSQRTLETPDLDRLSAIHGRFSTRWRSIDGPLRRGR